jgi:hypothetical protein
VGEDDDNAVWVNSEPSIDGGTYTVTVQYTSDRARTLTRDEGFRYVSTVLDAVNRAQYDAAVLRQFTRVLDADLSMAAEVVKSLRKDRPPLNEEDIAPLRLIPGVSAHTGDAFLEVHVEDKRLGQWDAKDALEHITYVLEAFPVADLDAAYYRVLVGVYGVDPDRARGMVGDLVNWRS